MQFEFVADSINGIIDFFDRAANVSGDFRRSHIFLKSQFKDRSLNMIVPWTF